MKVCKKCKELKPLSEYHKRSKSTDGLFYQCKECVRTHQLAAYHARRDEIIKHRKDLIKADIEKHRELCRQRATKKKRKSVRVKWEFMSPVQQQKDLARRKVRHQVRMGYIPIVRTLSCVDCNQPATDYDHYKGYATENWLEVQPVCRRCNIRRAAEAGTIFMYGVNPSG